ncbi:hypothetical protein E2I00_014037, partial [Balaenoptera physalus]
AAAPAPAELLGGLGHLQRRCPGADLAEVQERVGLCSGHDVHRRLCPVPVGRPCCSPAQPGSQTLANRVWARVDGSNGQGRGDHPAAAGAGGGEAAPAGGERGCRGEGAAWGSRYRLGSWR